VIILFFASKIYFSSDYTVFAMESQEKEGDSKHKNIVHMQPRCKTGMIHARLAKRRRIL